MLSSHKVNYSKVDYIKMSRLVSIRFYRQFIKGNFLMSIYCYLTYVTYCRWKVVLILTSPRLELKVPFCPTSAMKGVDQRTQGPTNITLIVKSLFVCNRGDAKQYNGNLHTRKLGQAPYSSVPNSYVDIIISPA